MAGAEWSITEVSRMSGASARMLRHYDAIGLLRPARIAGSGYRWYGQEELLRLQQILLLRELGVGLATIAEVLDGDKDPAEVLRRHRDALIAERGRIDRLVSTVSTTIDELEGELPVTTENMFDGFDPATVERGRAEMRDWLVDKYGENATDSIDEKFAQSAEVTKDWTEADYRSSVAEQQALDTRLVGLVHSGAATDSAETFACLDDHYAAVSTFWTPDRASYTGLGEMYVENEQFRARYAALDPALPVFLRDAIAAYARTKLA